MKVVLPETPRRVTFFLRTLGNGGIQRVMVNLSRGFLERGLKVDLVLSIAGGLDLWNFPSEVRIIDLKSPRVSASIPRLIHYLQQEKPVGLFPALHYVNEVALIAKRLARVPTQVIVSEHTSISRELQREVGTRKHLIPLFIRCFYPMADNVVAVSHGVAQDLTQTTSLSQDRCKVIYNPVITPELQEMAKQPVDHPWFAAGGPPVILGVGRLEAQKDFPNLIRAFHRVRQSSPARLMILGEGADRPQLETLILELGLEGEVALPGFVKNPFAYMAKAAVFALSSAWEGLPTVLIEAMAVGTPVVSTNCENGPAEILKGGKYGALVPVGESEVLASAILNVLVRGCQSVDPNWLEQFTVEAATQQYLDLLGISAPLLHQS